MTTPQAIYEQACICFPDRWLSTPESSNLERDEMWQVWRDIEANVEGGCRWCGGPLKKRQRKYCCQTCVDAFYHTFEWQWASKQAVRRAHYRCQCCGFKPGCRKSDFVSLLNVHHIIPVNGEVRTWHPFNHPGNLIVLCHDCHVAIHAKLNELVRVPMPPKLIDLRQQVMELGL